jgi:hypothetical protein
MKIKKGTNMTSKYLRSTRKRLKKNKLKGKVHPCLGEKQDGSRCGKIVQGGWLCPSCKQRVNDLDGSFGEHFELHSPY